MSEAMYQQAANQSAGQTNTNPNDDVVDADFEKKN